MEFWETYDSFIDSMLNMSVYNSSLGTLKADATDLDKLKYYAGRLKVKLEPPYDLSFIRNKKLREDFEIWFSVQEPRRVTNYPKYFISRASEIKEYWGSNENNRWSVVLSDDRKKLDELLIENEKLRDKINSLQKDSLKEVKKPKKVVRTYSDYIERRILYGDI